MLTRVNALIIALVLSLISLSSCGKQPPKNNQLSENPSLGTVSFNLSGMITVFENDGNSVHEKSGPPNFNISLIRIFKEGASWSRRLGMPDAITWTVPGTEFPKRVEFELPEGDYMFESVLISYGPWDAGRKAIDSDGMAYFHVVANKSVDLGTVIIDHVKKMRIYPNQTRESKHMRIKVLALSPEGRLRSNPEKIYDLGEM